MHYEERKSVINSAHPEPWEAKEADPTWVEQESISHCLKLPVSLTTSLKAEISAGEGQEKAQELLFCRRMNAMCQAGHITSVTRDTAGFMQCFSQLQCPGWGGGCARPSPEIKQGLGSLCSLLALAAHASRSWGVFREKGMLGVILVQIPTQFMENTLHCLFCISN